MKTQYALIGILITSVAHSADFGLYANAVSARNIAAAQHEISNRVFIPMRNLPTVAARPATDKASTKASKSGDADEYGEMLYYGEFGDDTGVLPLVTGRSGGENGEEYVRIGWQHFSDNVKVESGPRLKSTSDLAFVSYGNAANSQRLEFFGGYSGGRTKKDALDIDTDGAFIGATFGKKLGEFELSVMADLGLALSDVGSTIYGGDFSNLYFGIMANAAYEYSFDSDVFFRPSLRAGYTWINSANYMSKDGNNITNKDYSIFELTPMLDILGEIGDGLSIGAHVGYVMNFVSGGDVAMDYTALPKLDINDYVEYGIILAQKFDGFSLNINFGRHDGARNGWNGGAEFKYVF